MADKGLGMGLGALFGSAALSDSPNDFDYISISKIEPRTVQPRLNFDEAGIQELASSIEEHGVLQPLTVRPIGGGYYQIVAGERRWRAARIAGLQEVPARIVEADDRKATELALVENLQREDLNPIEEARGYSTLMTEFGFTQEELSKRISKSRPSVANSLRLLSLPENIMKMLESGKLSAGAARALLPLKDGHKIESAASFAAERDLSVREVEALVKKLSKAPEKRAKPAAPAVDYLAEAERRLTSALGRRVRIFEGRNKGTIEIEYYDRDDFDALFDFLSSVKPGGGAK